MPFHLFPNVNKCCICVTDLKVAVAIIIVIGIVTSPAVSWAIVRHSYVIHVSCYVTTSEGRQDVVDINLSNVLSFGFGANAGLGPSCLKSKIGGGGTATTESDSLILLSETGTSNPKYVQIIKYLGWIVLLSDLVFLVVSVILLVRLFKPEPLKKIIKIYMWTVLVSAGLSFIYGMLYVIVCLLAGGAFPIFEFVFTFFDLLLWVYFLMVVNSYRKVSTAN